MAIELQGLPSTPDLSPKDRETAEGDLRNITNTLVKSHVSKDFAGYIQGLVESVTPDLNLVLQAVGAGDLDKARVTIAKMIETIHPEILDVPEEIASHANIQAMLPAELMKLVGSRDMLVLLTLFQLKSHLGDEQFALLIGDPRLKKYGSFLLMAQLLPTSFPLPFKSQDGVEFSVELTPEGLWIIAKKVDLSEFTQKNLPTIEAVAAEVGVTRERLENVLALIKPKS